MVHKETGQLQVHARNNESGICALAISACQKRLHAEGEEDKTTQSHLPMPSDVIESDSEIELRLSTVRA